LVLYLRMLMCLAERYQCMDRNEITPWRASTVACRQKKASGLLDWAFACALPLASFGKEIVCDSLS
jgi:hypothetical protein